MTADERFYPDEFKLYFDSYIRHFDRYFESLKMINKTGQNEKWLDCACGSGYGTNFLSNFCSKIIGYDISKEAVKYANLKYKKNNCSFVFDTSIIKDNSIDVITSIETIEHMPQKNATLFLMSLNNMLKEDGIFVITTPIVEKTNHSPINKFHFLEYSNEDFISLLNSSKFKIIDTKFIKTIFTDGEIKYQGYYKCKKTR
jgi:2-polyprenyl-3-methyl-5-hydroxy-6-metoxy-1,4-benzoquinol methylase